MKVGEIIGKTLTEEREQNSTVFCLPRCFIGLEYEWEDVHFQPLPNDHGNYGDDDDIANRVRKYYSVHQDGSLRNGGMEFVFSGPLAGTRLYNAIEAMDDLSRARKFKSSYRTSMHVHIDTNSLVFPEEILSIATLYAIFEPFIYKFIGKGRDGSNYCVPWYTNSQHYEVFLDLVRRYGDSGPGKMRSSIINSKAYKYSGMNFFSLGDYGTLEFRQAPVDMQLAKIITWINIIMRLKQFVSLTSSCSSSHILSLAHKHDVTWFANKVFQEEAEHLLKLSKSPQDDFFLGLKTAYHFDSLTP